MTKGRCIGRFFSVSIDLLKEKQDPSVVQRVSFECTKESTAGGEKIGFRERAIERVAAAHQALEHGILDGHPFDDEVAASQAMTKSHDRGQRNLLHQQQVMDDCEHQHQVELALEPG